MARTRRSATTPTQNNNNVNNNANSNTDPNARLEQLVARLVAEAVAVIVANRSSTQGETNGTTTITHAGTYKEFHASMQGDFRGVEGALGLTRGFERLESVGIDTAHATQWSDFKQMLIQKHGHCCYTQRFQELSLLCPEMVPTEARQIERYINGLPEPTRARSVDRNKRKWESNHRINDDQQQMCRMYTAGSSSRNGYARTLPPCDQCNFHHYGSCLVRCGNCKKLGHPSSDCRTTNSVTCYECREEGNIIKYCPYLEDQTKAEGACLSLTTFEQP
ncbi:reverse transcriptase domain-containing protein [Tanacetum coccineum]|uniref:Reverse transcriptase domain-containing protein n=1 Tax=Tanacetum coccineum TaxID=301880 RepID=A0ABQ5BIE2_9ASTR